VIPIPPNLLEAVYGNDKKKKAQDQSELSQAGTIMQIIREMAAQQVRETGLSDPKESDRDEVAEKEWGEVYDAENSDK